jgi:hypothetical protein
MPINLPLPAPWNARWKAKIQDRELNEEPHVTIIKGACRWRWGLRSRGFMDREPDPGDVPAGLVDHLRDRMSDLIAAWDQRYPENPVGSEAQDD